MHPASATLHATMPSVQALWSRLVIDELCRHGIRELVVAPGLRSAPLVHAISAEPRVRVTVCVDERAAGYFALGCARAGRPAAVVCTSGTAVAGLLPAVIEADLDRVPLVLVTADRPPELRRTGANQAIDQQSCLAAYLRWSFDLPVPDDRVPARFVLTTVDQLVRRATHAPAGPVQLNCMVREPLTPEPVPWSAGCLEGLEGWAAGEAPFTCQAPPVVTAAPGQVDALRRAMVGAERGLLVAGRLATAGDRDAVRRLAAATGWPLVADVVSGLRLGAPPPGLVRHLDLVPGLEPAPDCIVQLGGHLTSRRLLEALAGSGAAWWVVDDGPEREDPLHRTCGRVAAPPETCVAPLVSGLVASDTASPVASAADGAPSATAYRRLLERLDATAAAVLRARVDRATDRDPDGLSEAWVTRRLVAMLPSDHALFAGNSLPIRHLDGLAEPRAEPLASFANRGASGIDGILASAAGMVRGRRGPGVLLVGDLSLLHDLSSLWLLVRLAEKLIVVVLNNGGGGIFSLLPIVRHPSVLTPWVDAAHNLRLAGLAGELGVPSWRAETRRGFEETWQAALASPRSCLIEVVCPRHQHAALLEELRHEIARRVGARPAPSDDGPHRPQPSMHEKEVSR